MKLIDYIRGWLSAAAIYVVVNLTVGVVLTEVLDTSSTASEFQAAAYSAWLLPAALSAVAAIVAVRRRVTAAWWKWLILTVVIPTVGGAMALAFALDRNATIMNILPEVVVHVVLAGVLGVTGGTILNAVRKAARVGRNP